MVVDKLSKEIIKAGNGIDKPKAGNTVSLHYIGHLFEEGNEGNRGRCFDSSKERGEFTTVIGMKKVIQGWDEGVLDMTLGEKAVLTIPSNMAYGTRGFPDTIPPNADLIFEVELLAIEGKRAY